MMWNHHIPATFLSVCAGTASFQVGENLRVLFMMGLFETLYHESCEPLRIFGNDDTACST